MFRRLSLFDTFSSCLLSVRVVKLSLPLFSSSVILFSVEMHHSYYSPTSRHPSTTSPATYRHDPFFTVQSHPSPHPNAQSPQSYHSHTSYRQDRSDVTMAVHNLILSMKGIQESLRLWSLSQATPEQVSDCYMQFGVEFNVIVRAFDGYGIGTGDLHPIPASLRAALENLLGEDPSPGALAMYMPEIRGLLCELLQGLKAKQAAWKAATSGPLSAVSRE